jgi:hypothetical protein
MDTHEKDAGYDHAKLHWHPGILHSMKLDLSNYLDFLEFKYEHQLTSEPLRIDLIIIKKLKSMAIDKNIARMFRTYNIVEYKSPDDYLSVNDFLKVYAYAYLYASITPGVDLSDITLTFIESRHPHKLLRYLTDVRDYTIEETSLGIYQVSGDYVPIQVIESKKLSEGENLWLKSLSNDLDFRSMKIILEASQKHKHKEEISVYLDLILRANQKTFLEVLKMGYPTMEEVLTEAGYLPEWLERGRAQGLEQGIVQGRAEGMEAGKLEDARKMKEMGDSVEKIQIITGLPSKTIEQL